MAGHDDDVQDLLDGMLNRRRIVVMWRKANGRYAATVGVLDVEPVFPPQIRCSERVRRQLEATDDSIAAVLRRIADMIEETQNNERD